MYFRARTARTGVTHAPEVILFAQAGDRIGPAAKDLLPYVECFIVILIIAARLVERDRVEPHPEEAPGGGALVEAVAAGVIRDDGAVLRAAEVITPGPGRVGTRDYIFTGGIVEVSVLHNCC